MSLTLPLSITVGTDVGSLPRTQGPDGRTAQYEWSKSDGTRQMAVKISHTVPTTNGGKESHLARLDVQDYDSEGLPTRQTSVWIVAQTLNASQDTTLLVDVYEALTNWLAATTNQARDAIFAREL